MQVIMTEAEKRYLRIAEIATTIIAVFFIAFTLGCNIGKNEAEREAKVKYSEYEQKIADMESEKAYGGKKRIDLISYRALNRMEE